ncbi:MAG: hypothetical protein LBN95_13855 [Prevotellaceae bacterium]|jgi:predicted choloylglycine hydrolase|nr:hypothetical protein [Prevotellaceae bacterium]
MGKKLTRNQLHTIQVKAKELRQRAGFKTVSVKKYNLKQCEAVKKAAQIVLHKPKQKSFRFKK